MENAMNGSPCRGEPVDTNSVLLQAVVDAGGVLRSGMQGATVCRWQGQPRAFLFVTSGRLSVHVRTWNRRAPWAECGVSGGEDCMPVTAAILSERAIMLRAVCASASTWLELAPAKLVALLHDRPDFRRALFAGHAERLPSFIARVSARRAVSLDRRIAGWLLAHAEVRTVRATHADIAEDLLTAREVVSRNLGDFAAKGWIEQRRGCIRIEAPAALSRVSRGQYSLCNAPRVGVQGNAEC
jgi:CRP/FNR family transcriptional regulator